MSNSLVLSLLNIVDHAPFLVNCVQYFLICDFLCPTDLQHYPPDSHFKHFYLLPMILCHGPWLSRFSSGDSGLFCLSIDFFLCNERVLSHILSALDGLIAVSIFVDHTSQELELFYLLYFLYINKYIQLLPSSARYTHLHRCF